MATPEPTWEQVLDAAWVASQESWYVGDRNSAVQVLLTKVPRLAPERAREAFVEIDRLRDIAVEIADDFRDKRIRTQKDALRELADRCPTIPDLIRGSALQFGLMVTR